MFRLWEIVCLCGIDLVLRVTVSLLDFVKFAGDCCLVGFRVVCSVLRFTVFVDLFKLGGFAFVWLLVLDWFGYYVLAVLGSWFGWLLTNCYGLRFGVVWVLLFWWVCYCMRGLAFGWRLLWCVGWWWAGYGCLGLVGCFGSLVF